MEAPPLQHEKSELLNDLDDDEDVLRALKSMPSSPDKIPAKMQALFQAPLGTRAWTGRWFMRWLRTEEGLVLAMTFGIVVAHMTKSFPKPWHHDAKSRGSMASNARAWFSEWLKQPQSSQKFKFAEKASKVWLRYKQRHES